MFDAREFVLSFFFLSFFLSFFIQMTRLDEWAKYYEKKYPKVGRLVVE